jgi:hypothetical protein
MYSIKIIIIIIIKLYRSSIERDLTACPLYQAQWPAPSTGCFTLLYVIVPKTMKSDSFTGLWKLGIFWEKIIWTRLL